MNSRERRKLAAIQHNDAIAYEEWLIKNTLHQSRIAEVDIYARARKRGLSRQAALAICNAISTMGMSGYVR